MSIYNKYKEDGAIHYEWYNTVPWYKELVDKCVEFAEGKCLDLGCGDGVVCQKISDRGLDILGIDNSKEGLDLAKEYAPKAHYLLANINDLYLKENFDTLICLNIIEHIENPENILTILKNNINKKAIVFTDKKMERDKHKSHFREFTIKELKELFKGYKIKKIKLKTKIFIGIEVYK